MSSPREMVFVAKPGHGRTRARPNPMATAVRSAQGCWLTFTTVCWLQFEAWENWRVPESLRVRSLPGSCAGCAFGTRVEVDSRLPLFCEAAHQMMPRPPFDSDTRRALFCPLAEDTEDAAARLEPGRCPAAERMAGEVIIRN